MANKQMNIGSSLSGVDLNVSGGLTLNGNNVVVQSDIENLTSKDWFAQHAYADNLLPYPYATSSTTLANVAFTDLGDGSLKLNGTSSSAANFNMFFRNTTFNGVSVTLKAGQTYTIGGATIEDWSQRGFCIRVMNKDNNKVLLRTDMEGKQTATMDADYENCGVFISVAAQKTFNNMVIKPILTLGDSTYVFTPYANSNSTLRNDVNIIQQKLLPDKYIFIGDSYGTSLTPSPKSWIDYTAEMLGLTENIDFYRNAVGGYGFANPNASFLSLLNGLSNQITNKNSITKIVVCGGYNDYVYATGSQVDALLNAISSFISQAKTDYPNATVYIGFIGWERSNASRDNRLNLNNACEIYNTAACRFGAKFMDNVQYIMHNYAYFSSDNIHPVTEGSSAIAHGIASVLKNDTYNHMVSYQTTDVAAAAANSTFGPGCISQRIDNGMVTLNVHNNGGNANWKKFITTQEIVAFMPNLDPYGWQDLATINNSGFIWGGGNTIENVMVHVPVVIGNFHHDAEIRFKYGKMQIRIYGNGKTYPAGQTVWIPPFAATFPTMMA